MGLNYYEKKLVKTLKNNPDINTRRFIKKSRLGKTSFYKYSQRLEISGYIAYKQVKNQRLWFLPIRDERHDLGLPKLESKYLQERYQKIEFKVIKGIRQAKKGNVSEKIDVYSNAIVLILATLDSMKLISIYRRKRIPNDYVRFTRKLELLLKKISSSRFFSQYGYGRIAIDGITYDAEEKLNEFLGIDSEEGKKTYIY